MYYIGSRSPHWKGQFWGKWVGACNVLGECGFGDAASSKITLRSLVIIKHAKIKVTHCIVQVIQYQKQCLNRHKWVESSDT